MSSFPQAAAAFPEGVSATDEHGGLIYSSRAHDTMFGYAPGELLGRHAGILNAYPPEENARFTREVIAQLREKGEWVGEISNVRKDGTPFTTRARMTGLNLGGKVHWVCVQEDLTSHKLLDAERLRAREQAQALTATLRESEARYRQLVEHASDGIFLADLEGRYVDVNSSGCRMLGYTREALLGLGIADVLVPEDVPRFAQLRAHLLAAPDALQVAEWTVRWLLKLAHDAEHLRLLRALGTTRIAIIPPGGAGPLAGRAHRELLPPAPRRRATRG